MNRSGLTFLLLLVVLGLAGGTLAEGRRATRRDHSDAGRAELELELPGAIPLSVAPAMPGAPAALPAVPPSCGPGVVVRLREAALSSCSPVEPAPLVACSRAPPILG